MVEINLADPNFVDNAIAVLRIKKMGFSDAELEELYKRQVEEDLKEVKHD